MPEASGEGNAGPVTPGTGGDGEKGSQDRPDSGELGAQACGLGVTGRRGAWTEMGAVGER